MEYDDITLMKFADGELDRGAALQLKKDLLQNPELRDRLKTFTLTREALLMLNQEQKYPLPDHIAKLIDTYHQKKTRSNIFQLFPQRPAFSLAASVTLGVLIGAGAMQVATTITPPEISRLEKTYESGIAKPKATRSPISVQPTANHSEELQKAISRFLDILAADSAGQLLAFRGKGKHQTIKIIAEFKNSQGKPCKLGQYGENYLVACVDENDHWSITQSR